MKIKTGFRVGLALGGGGARGFAHIGVLKALNSHSIPIDLVVGTSIGAIIGAAFCLKPDPAVVEKKLLEMVSSPEIKRLESFFARDSEEVHEKFLIQKLLSKIKNLYLWNLHAAKKWLVRTEPISRVLERFFDNRRFSDLQVPFACVAVDLNNASEVVIQEGRILEAVLGSSSIPGIFAPLKRGNKLLIDGGTISSIPARQARILGADFVIGVDLSSAYSRKEFLSGLDVMFQADQVKDYYLNKLNLKYCDWIIRPEMLNVAWSTFSQSPFCIRQGELAALRDVDEIKRALNKKKIFFPLRRLFSKRRACVD